MTSPIKSTEKAKILLVEDELILRKNLARFLRRTGHEVVCAGDSNETFRLLRQEPLDILITDLILPDGEAFSFIAEAKRRGLRILVMTAYGSPQIEERLRAVPVVAYLEKPLRLETVLSSVEKAFIACTSHPRELNDRDRRVEL